MPKTDSLTLSWGKLGAGLLLLLGAQWAIYTQVFGGTKDDVREIRGILEKLADEDKTIREIVVGGDGDLRNMIAETRETVIRNEAAIEAVRLIAVATADDVKAIRVHLLKE